MDGADGMREFLAYHRRMLILMAVACVVVAVGLVLALPGELSWAGGFVAGAAAQLVKFGVLDVAAIKKLATQDKGAAAAQVKALYISLVLYGMAVYVVYKFGLNVWAMAAGIFLPRVLLLADAYLRPNPFKHSDEAAAWPEAEDNGV